MEIQTEKKKEKQSLITQIRAEYEALKALPGAQRTPIYKSLAERHSLSERTIHTYVKK